MKQKRLKLDAVIQLRVNEAILLQRVAPETAAGYMRFYLRSAGLSAPAGDPTTVFASAFPIPDAIRDAITRQLDVVLGGI